MLPEYNDGYGSENPFNIIHTPITNRNKGLNIVFTHIKALSYQLFNPHKNGLLILEAYGWDVFAEKTSWTHIIK